MLYELRTQRPNGTQITTHVEGASFDEHGIPPQTIVAFAQTWATQDGGTGSVEVYRFDPPRIDGLSTDITSAVCTVLGEWPIPTLPPVHDDVVKFLSNYDAWCADRDRVNALEAAGKAPSSAWHNSDDSAVELMHEAAQLLKLAQ